MFVSDIFNLIYNSPAPLAVVNEEDHVIGVVVRGSVIGAMSTDNITVKSDDKSTEEGVNANV